MISVQDLKESLYQDCYFTEQANSLRIQNEHRRSGTPILLYVDIHSSGTFIQIGNGILKKSQEIFQTEDKRQGRIGFRNDCDGVCILNIKERNILLLSEVKSGFNNIKNKGFEQLVASYIKIRSILHTIEEYRPNDYEEVAILFSYPPQAKQELTNKDVFASKTQIVAPSPIDEINNKYAAALRVENEVSIDLNDYHVNQCHINPSLYNRTLKVIYVPVEDESESFTFDIDSLLL